MVLAGPRARGNNLIESGERGSMANDIALLTIREATESDDEAITRLTADANMGTLTPRGRAFIAECTGQVLGFIRIVEAEGHPYVTPIVVDTQARRSGVGRALMDDARSRYGALLFVARGEAVPFYEALGCERVPAELISSELGEDCDTCPDFTTCGPVPMIYR